MRGEVRPRFRHLDLARRVEQRDRTVVNACVATYGDFIYGLAKRFTCCPQATEELTLEIFDQLWRKGVGGYCQDSSEQDFVIEIVRRTIRKHIRTANLQNTATSNFDKL